MLGLAHLVRIEVGTPDDSSMPAKGQMLATGGDKKKMTETMITAHEALIDVAPDNIVKFKDVLAYLKEDLKRVAPPADGASIPPQK